MGVPLDLLKPTERKHVRETRHPTTDSAPPEKAWPGGRPQAYGGIVDYQKPERNGEKYSYQIYRIDLIVEKSLEVSSNFPGCNSFVTWHC